MEYSLIRLFVLLIGCKQVPKNLDGTNMIVKKETHPTTENTSELKALDKFWRLLRPIRIITTGVSK